MENTSKTKGILQYDIPAKKASTKTVINIDSSSEFSSFLNREVFMTPTEHERLSPFSTLKGSQLFTEHISTQEGRPVEEKIDEIENTEDIFSNENGIPSELIDKIFRMIEPEDMPKVPYISKNWFNTCKQSLFITKHCEDSRMNNYKHKLFYVPENKEAYRPFFLQLDPLVNENRTLDSFARVPNFVGTNEITLVDADEGVLCFLGKDENNDACFYLWNPITHKNVSVELPDNVNPGMRYGFGLITTRANSRLSFFGIQMNIRKICD
ncbi:uncharacterized protein G2W53_033002 [Senna tora]|uniref:F-box domain-containing protein n=1 Tax=Senna tora TaxID=362788 RepID=A0A834T092_9FABA|nr:uncharacterized protein G2W53_033002 [Senna tora]